MIRSPLLGKNFFETFILSCVNWFTQSRNIDTVPGIILYNLSFMYNKH